MGVRSAPTWHRSQTSAGKILLGVGMNSTIPQPVLCRRSDRIILVVPSGLQNPRICTENSHLNSGDLSPSPSAGWIFPLKCKPSTLHQPQSALLDAATDAGFWQWKIQENTRKKKRKQAFINKYKQQKNFKLTAPTATRTFQGLPPWGIAGTEFWRISQWWCLQGNIPRLFWLRWKRKTCTDHRKLRKDNPTGFKWGKCKEAHKGKKSSALSCRDFFFSLK